MLPMTSQLSGVSDFCVDGVSDWVVRHYGGFPSPGNDCNQGNHGNEGKYNLQSHWDKLKKLVVFLYKAVVKIAWSKWKFNWIDNFS
jgi:hypothetical protein